LFELALKDDILKTNLKLSLKLRERRLVVELLKYLALEEKFWILQSSWKRNLFEYMMRYRFVGFYTQPTASILSKDQE